MSGESDYRHSRSQGMPSRSLSSRVSPHRARWNHASAQLAISRHSRFVPQVSPPALLLRPGPPRRDDGSQDDLAAGEAT